MATDSKSDQVTKIDSPDFDMLKPNEAHGRERIAFFSGTTLATGGATGDTYQLCEVPTGARILGGTLATGALGTSIVAAIGITGSTAKYGTGIDIAAAGVDTFADTLALNYGVELSAKERIFMTLSGGTPAASIVYRGHVKYVVD
jgi:hypothetical protein